MITEMSHINLKTMKKKKTSFSFLTILTNLFDDGYILNQREKLTQLLSVQTGQALLIIIPVLFISIGIISCSDNDPQSIEPPTDSVSYVSKSHNIMEFQEKQPNLDIQNIPFENVENYFSDRLLLSQPQKLNLGNDSLSIFYSGGLLRKFKISWKGNELYLYNDMTTAWEYAGTKDKQSVLVLNTGFYLIKDENAHGVLSVMGQKHSLLSYSELIEYMGGSTLNANKQIVWLKMQSIFEQASSVEL